MRAETARFFETLSRGSKDLLSDARQFLQDLARKQAGRLIQDQGAALMAGAQFLRVQPGALPTGILEGGNLESLLASLERLIPAIPSGTDRGSLANRLLAGMGRSAGSLIGILPQLAGPSFGKLGTVLGTTATGAFSGSGGSQFGLGALKGGGLGFGLSLLTSLFGRRKTPREREAEIKQILEGQRFTPPESLSRDLAFGGEGFGERDFSAGDQPRLVVNVNVSAMNSRSFLDHGPALAQAVRDAMLHMHPINQLVRESF